MREKVESTADDIVWAFVGNCIRKNVMVAYNKRKSWSFIDIVMRS